MGELTTQTQPRPAVKGQVPISDISQLIPFPSLGPKLHCIFAIQIFPSMHVVHDDTDACAFADQDGARAIWAAAARDDGGLLGYADVDWNWRVEAESWTD